MRQLSPQDAQFLYMEDGHLASHLTSVAICDQSTADGGIVRFKDIIAHVEERLSASKIYNQRLMRVPLELDYPYWVEDPHFDNEYHITHGRLPEPQDWRQFCIHMARFHSRPLDMTRPPWEIYVVEGLGKIDGLPEKAFAIAIKIHHAAVDGTSIQEFIASLMDFSPEGPPVLPAPSMKERKAERPVTAGAIIRRAWWHNTTAPFKFAQATMKYAPGIARSTLRRFTTSSTSDSIRAPMTRFNGEISPHRAFDAVTFDLEEFKEVRRAFKDAKINDVVLAVCGGGLRKYLEDKNELPDESLIAAAPINERPPSADPVGAKADGNHVSAMSVPIYTNIADPSERLKAIVRTTRYTKAGEGGFQARLVADLGKRLPAASQAVITRLALSDPRLTARSCNLFISNVPGPPFPFYFCGAKVTNSFGMAPIGGGVGLFIATPSYAGKISFNLTTTRDIVPDTPYLANCLKLAFTELKSAAKKQGETASSTERKAIRRARYRVRVQRSEEMAENGQTPENERAPAEKAAKASRTRTKASTNGKTPANGADDAIVAKPTRRPRKPSERRAATKAKTTNGAAANGRTAGTSS
ncbi:MAG: wax ester/triacylglycerol synthase family O-acyltransferase [Pseudomonadota bacterium]